MMQQSSVSVDLEVDGVQVLAEVVDALAHGAAVLEEHHQAAGAAGFAVASQVGEAAHRGDGHAGVAQPEQEGVSPRVQWRL
nr:hypothetical protein [uncultured Pseudokineococcus sp.]